ncbi:MAG: hypothetical protein JO191_04725, partial [Mycobacteriaceae bacterium]|nr:hypothetical protein [Mycobacteriaceae bacterium]
TSFTAITAEETPAVSEACQQFSGAVVYADTSYEDFAYASAGSGNYVNYGDPNVDTSGVEGRTALRQAAAAAMTAAGTPGVPPEVSAPMQSWSMDAAKLLVMMGVHAGGDALNSAANDLNTDSHNAQLACAAAGSRA